ncbi:amino acid adenylation domain-containing protein [Streptomyces sp. NPDC002888]|uniref:amino acid adenylation domain-containing protein n=1 Tax=Streptomyces sp. NPDC002888 TaxID=3364668 RepID=UPI00367B3253
MAKRHGLTPYQHDIWVANSLLPDNPQFNCVMHTRLEGEVDRSALVRSVERAHSEFDALHLRFDEDEDGTPYQQFSEEPFRVAVIDLTGHHDPAAACAAWMESATVRPFPLHRSPLIEVSLLAESPAVTHVYSKVHHIVADGFSGALFDRRVFDHYKAALAGESVPADKQSAYLPFVEANAKYRASQAYLDDLAYCRSAVEGAVPALFSRKAASGGRRSASHSFVIERETMDRIRAAGYTPFAYLATVLGGYLSRVLGRDEVILGIALANRWGAQKRVVGDFANTLPLRLCATDTTSLHDLVGQVQDAILPLARHSRLSLGDLLRALPRPSTGNDARQLFDVTFSYLQTARPEDVPGAVRETNLLNAGCHDQDALNVYVTVPERGGDARVDLVHAKDVFDADFSIESVAGHLQSLVRDGLEKTDLPLTAVPMLTPGERADLGEGRSRGPVVALPEQATLHGLFETQVARDPDRIALVGPADDQTMTYGELDKRANRLARALRAEGVGPGDRVAVMMERGPQLLVALFGVLKAGGAYVPVDPGYPEQRIRFLLEDSDARIVLADSAVPAGAAEAPGLRRVAELLDSEESAQPVAPLATSGDLAYVIYTSGSTGIPKGVMVEHRSVVNRLAWMQHAYPIGEGDTLLQKTPISFDVSVWELFWWAIEGVRLVLLPPGGEKDPKEILRVVGEHRVTMLHSVPSMLGPLLELLDDSSYPAEQVRSLRYVFCSGEALAPARVEQFNRVTDRRTALTARLVNLYGPTEATVDVSWYECPATCGERVGRVPIGIPVDNTQLYVLDRHGELQPVGVPGELYIGGVQVARGYLHRPELTRDRFVDDPFTPGGRLYRTGDRARWLADGTLEYLGRADGQVKIRGNRVETREVSAALAAVPGVRDAIVVDRHEPSRGTHLVGYYVSEEEHEPGGLRRILGERLPEFMIPSIFQRIDRIPLTPNGKADRSALPAPSGATTPSVSRPPANAVEAELAAIWAGVLHIGTVGVNDDYYALGGDSITMLRIRAQAERRGLHFSLADLVSHPTIEALAALLCSRTDRRAADPDLTPFALIPNVDRARLAAAQDAYPLTRLQLGLLYHGNRGERAAAYRDVFRYTLEMPWAEPAFRGAFRALAERHPVLRSSFDLARLSEPVQIIHTTAVDVLEVLDLRSSTDAEAEIGRYIEERRHHDYALEQGELYRLRAHLRPDTVELVLSFHHALLDGGSVANLMAELLQDYAHQLGLPIDPVDDGALPSGAHFVRAEQQALLSQKSRSHWRQLLADAEPLALGTLRPHQTPRGHTGQTVRDVELPEDLTVRIEQLARDNALQVKSVFLAAHCLALQLVAGTDDVTTGMITHGRPELEGGDRIAGLFLNTVPVRRRERGASWLDVVREVFRQEQEGHPHRHYPISAIQQDHGAPVMRTAFNYVRFRQLDQVLALPGIRLRAFGAWEETDFDLLVNVYTDPDSAKVRVRVDCADNAFSPDQADLLARFLVALLHRMAERPDETPDFAFLAPSLIRAEPGADARRSVVQRFLEQAASTPQADAVVMDDERWTYERLANASRTVARQLLAAGLPSGARVGIAMDRSPLTVAATVGTLMAGAAVVPLDMAFPKARISSMVRQAEPFRIITERGHEADLGDGVPVMYADSITEEVPGTFDMPEPDPESVAYVLFTSGSTGEPKAVAMPHRGMANLVAWQNRQNSGAVKGATLAYAPMSFDVSFQEMFSTLCGGGTLHLVTESERRDLPALLRRIDREGIERVFFPYVVLQQFAEAATTLGIAPRRLRVLVSSGEQLRVTGEIRALMAMLPGALLENQYGPTESHVVTAFTMTGDSTAFPALPPIGRAIDGAEVHVLDSKLRPVPRGALGELYIGGVCLALGYPGRPDLTRERFVDHPSGTAGEVLYRTGDIALTLPDGDIVCVGRADDQVKIRGYRVEPAEAEVAVVRLAEDDPGIQEVAVVARRAEDGNDFLTAFLSGDPARADLDGLRSRLRDMLPEYLVPSRFEWLPALPLTPSGKRDDAALRSIPLTGPDTTAGRATDTTAPRDEYERVLADILADLLRVPSVGVHSNMFDLGGTSLTAMRMVVHVEQRYGVAISLSDFIAAPTVAELANRLHSDAAAPVFDPLVPIRPEGTRPPLFMVHPMGGNVLCYLRFARHLSADQPLYALQAAGADPGVAPLRSLPELAESYLAAIRRVQPHGPYTIGGWSFGGFVAFEMARQLTAAGEEVADLIVLDTVAATPGTRPRHSDDQLLTWFFWEMLLTLGGESAVSGIPAELVGLEEKFAFIADSAARSGVLPAGSSSAVVERLFHVYESNWTAALQYMPDTADLDLTLIRANDPLPEVLRSMHDSVGTRYLDADNGWRQLTGRQVEVIQVPGDHLSIMKEPYVEHVAKTVGELLERRSATASTDETRKA